MIWAVRNYEEAAPIILSVSENDEITIRQAADSIVKALEFPGTIEHDTSKADGQYKKTVTNKKLRKYLPNFKFTPFDQAIKETTEWFVNNYKSCRTIVN